MMSDLVGFVVFIWKSFLFLFLMFCFILCFFWILFLSWKEEIEFEKEFWVVLEGSNCILFSKIVYWVIIKKVFLLKCFYYGEILKKNEVVGDGVLICYGFRNLLLLEFFWIFLMWSFMNFFFIKRLY